jgi:hypothetical protein
MSHSSKLSCPKYGDSTYTADTKCMLCGANLDMLRAAARYQ